MKLVETAFDAFLTRFIEGDLPYDFELSDDPLFGSSAP